MESSKIHPRPRQSRRRPMHDQSFASYLPFGIKTTLFLASFLGLYALVLLCLSPLLSTTSGPANVPTKRGEALKPALAPLLEKVKHIKPHVPGQLLAEGIAKDVQKRIANYKKKEGLSDASLLQKATADISQIRKRRSTGLRPEDSGLGSVQEVAPGQRSGFVVLGMHRSGTSMLSGLLVTGAGYKTGGPLIGSAFDNEKGFFELLDVVLQNDELMKKQRVWWDAGVIQYDAEQGLEDRTSGRVDFEKGDRALKLFLNNPKNGPWLQKDPRMCITLKTWLPLFTVEPAVVFTYRHPLEVALSLKKREQRFSLQQGLRLWIVYNRRALENSAGLCRVLSSNEAVLADPLTEVQRIADELTKTCGVPAPPRELEQADVDKFVDPDLQHNKKEREEKDAGKAIISETDGCVIREYESTEKEGSSSYKREYDLYGKAMKIYCDLKSGAAYKDNYEWPDLD